jgi:N-acylneuraminate cytidylyltransferase/CMP-N,N'-diacetyllegionaminic acid synthase
LKVLAVISARGGSKGVPRKNVRDFGGIPLIAHMFLKAKNCPEINKVICSTDDSEIASIAKNYGIDVPFIRPQELSDDRAPLISSTKHAMLTMDELGHRSDIIVQLSPTCPFLKTESISKSIKYVSANNCECAVSLKKIEHEHPYRARKLLKDDYFENFVQDVNVEDKRYHSRQDLPILYSTSGALYTRKRQLLEQFDESDFAMGKLRKGILMDDIESINIDRMIDFHFAQFLLSQEISKQYI